MERITAVEPQKLKKWLRTSLMEPQYAATARIGASVFHWANNAFYKARYELETNGLMENRTSCNFVRAGGSNTTPSLDRVSIPH
jgi:hypothetical protein